MRGPKLRFSRCTACGEQIVWGEEVLFSDKMRIDCINGCLHGGFDLEEERHKNRLLRPPVPRR